MAQNGIAGKQWGWRPTRRELEQTVETVGKQIATACEAGDYGRASQLELTLAGYRGMLERQEYLGGEGDQPVQPAHKALFLHGANARTNPRSP